jgi:hypothetical protein
VLTAMAFLVSFGVAVDAPSSAWADLDPAVLATVALAAVIGFLSWQVMAVLPTTSPAAIRTTHLRSTKEG